MRLIDADALVERIKYSFHPYERVSIETITGCFLDETGCSPTIDATPVVYGHWTDDDNCSMCGFHITQKTRHYCPSCGAKMMDEVSE